MKSTAPAITPLTGRKILIVEDEMLLALDLQLLLEDQGFEVLGPAPNTKRALKILSESRPDAATLDMNLNGHSSAPVAEALREMDIPYIVISGYSIPSAAAAEPREPPRLTKPISNTALLRELAALLGD